MLPQGVMVNETLDFDEISSRILVCGVYDNMNNLVSCRTCRWRGKSGNGVWRHRIVIDHANATFIGTV